MELMQANREWASRPADERFVSLLDMQAKAHAIKDSGREREVSSRSLRFVPDAAEPMRGLRIEGPNGGALGLTNWAFGQVARAVGAYPSYLSRLPAPLVADAMNYHLQVDTDPTPLLAYYGADDRVMRAATGPKYGRIYNADIVDSLVSRFGDGFSGDWRVPGTWGKALTEVTKENTTLFMSDRDMFCFLADEKNKLELPNRRNGKAGALSRGIFFRNSEVGNSSVQVTMFLFDFVCGNRIVWGATDVEEIRIRHSVTAPDRWLDESLPVIKAYAESAASPIEAKLIAAQNAKLEKADEWLANRFGKKAAATFAAAHMADESRPIESLWDVATAITAAARDIEWQDARVDMEREAGKVLDLVAA